MFYLRQGKVKIAVTSDQGKEAIVAILGAGDFFGEGCLAGQPLRIATAPFEEIGPPNFSNSPHSR